MYFNAARTYAQAASALHRQRSGVNRVSPYASRAFELVTLALETFPSPSEKQQFWRTYVASDDTFRLIRHKPEYIRMSSIYEKSKK